VVHQYNRWSERAWVQIPLSSTLSFALFVGDISFWEPAMFLYL
jgi:hypothetical protein